MSSELMRDEDICAEIAQSIASEAHERKLGGRTVWRHDSDHSSSAAMSPTSPDLKDWNANMIAKDLVLLIGAFVFFTIQSSEILRLNRCTAASKRKRTPRHSSPPVVN